MYSAQKKRFNAKGTRSSPKHPIFGTPRIFILASKHPKMLGNEKELEQSGEESDDADN